MYLLTRENQILVGLGRVHRNLRKFTSISNYKIVKEFPIANTFQDTVIENSRWDLCIVMIVLFRLSVYDK